jgi:hypothetical protein
MVKDIRSRRDEVEKLKYKRKWYRMRRFRGKERGNYYAGNNLMSRKVKVKVKQSHSRPGVAQRVPGS